MHALHMRAVEHTIRRGLCTHHAAWANHTENRCLRASFLRFSRRFYQGEPSGRSSAYAREERQKGLTLTFTKHALRACLVRFTFPSPTASVSGGSWPPR